MTEKIFPTVEGYSIHEPIPDEDWVDEVRWQLNYDKQDRKGHNRDGFLCHIAGSDECLALGHKPDPEDGWDSDDNYDLHPYGWGGERICPATRFDSACTLCESEDCDHPPLDTDAFWGLFRG